MIESLKTLGVSEAATFPVKNIAFNDFFRQMCADNLCGRYGKNHMCPPGIGEPAALREKALSYNDVILIQTIYPLEDSYDFEGMADGNAKHTENIKKVKVYIQQNVPHTDMLILGAGGCSICGKCAIVENEPCRHPDDAISSVEGYCMDVAKMTEEHGLHYINGKDTVSYVAVFLLK
ncbi:hypothetical protein FACS1894105_13800 [Clostridia bacterium]|nr:hypothetical protein FACS1894105_13800 [Clostridia bacterium]